MTDLPIRLALISENGASPYEVTPLSSSKRRNLSTLMMNSLRVLNSEVKVFGKRVSRRKRREITKSA
jgi:hypothetical protein